MDEINLTEIRIGDLIEFKNGERLLVRNFIKYKRKQKVKIYFSETHNKLYEYNGRCEFYSRDYDIVKIIKID